MTIHAIVECHVLITAGVLVILMAVNWWDLPGNGRTCLGMVGPDWEW